MALFPFDDEYVRRLRDGDRETEEHFVRYFQVPLTVKLRRRGCPEGDIPDLIQITLMRVLKLVRADKVRKGQGFGALVNTTCVHVAQEDERKRRTTEELDFDYPSNEPDALHRLIDEEKQRRVRRVFQSFVKDTPRDAEILRDLYYRELPKDEICRKHRVKRDYLRVVLHRAIAKFREKYDDS